MTDDVPIGAETGAQSGLRLLVVDDSVDDFDLLVRVLRKAGIEPQATRVGSEPELREALSDGRWDVAVVDHVIPGYSGPQALQLLQSQAPDLAVVVVSGKVDEEVIAGDLRLGADDYVFKSGLSRLVPAIEQARQAAAGRRDRRGAEEALRASEARYRRVVEGTSEGLLELDAEYRIVTVNDRWLEMMGYGRADVLGRRVHDFLFEEDLPDLKANIELRRRGIAGRHERRFRRADGSELWAVISAVPKTAGDEAFDGVVALWLDITAQKGAQKTVADQERYYRSLIHSLHEDVLVIDHDYRITDINNMALHTLGVSREEAIGRRCHEVSHRVDSPCHEHGERCGLREVFASGEACNCHHVHRTADGSVVHVDILMAPLRDEDGTVSRVIEAARDVTDLFVAQEALGEHAERLRRTVEGAVDAMGSVVEMRDPYTAGHERRVTCLAVEIAQRLGLDEQRVEGLRLAGSVHDIGKIAVPAEILSKPGRLQEYEMNLVRTHAQVGHDVLAAIDFEQPVAEIVLQHHEKLDGSGYPGGLRGDEILLEARILTVADVVEAMSSHRPYRAALGMSAALAEIRAGAGTRYDAGAVAACEAAIADGFTFAPER